VERAGGALEAALAVHRGDGLEQRVVSIGGLTALMPVGAAGRRRGRGHDSEALHRVKELSL